ncbi:uncharacterized protein LOC125647397 [Ostrea edulis]|uniref:uncharacterized protein LOC125647397 n=1 Tax=Ostrea edulis TaxID=37623 RepID=UPI0024AED01E|nr:uncharacterized protein LOC125647397 [Ostrea edulis]
METGNSTSGSINIVWNEAIVNKINDLIFDKIYRPSFIYTIILLVIGCLGNSVVFYIYFTRWRKTTTSRVFILALAVFDLINNFIATPTELYFMLNWFQTTNGGLCKFSRFFTLMMNNCSSVTLLGIALDRYRSICRPFQTQMSAKKVKIIVFVGVFVAVVCACPALVVYGIQSITLPITLKTYIVVKMCMFEDGFVDTVYRIVLLAGNLLIDITLIIAYSFIAIHLNRRGSSFLCQTSKDMRKDSQSYSQSNTEDVFLDDKNSGESPSILKKNSKQHGSSQEKSDSESQEFLIHYSMEPTAMDLFEPLSTIHEEAVYEDYNVQLKYLNDEDSVSEAFTSAAQKKAQDDPLLQHWINLCLENIQLRRDLERELLEYKENIGVNSKKLLEQDLFELHEKLCELESTHEQMEIDLGARDPWGKLSVDELKERIQEKKKNTNQNDRQILNEPVDQATSMYNPIQRNQNKANEEYVNGRNSGKLVFKQIQIDKNKSQSVRGLSKERKERVVKDKINRRIFGGHKKRG